MKAMRIALTDETGKVYHWRINRVPRAVICTLGKTRITSGWQFTDHEDYERFAEGNWLDLVARFKETAANYGFSLMSELS